ncbi:MAG: amidohydrolase family protein [Saprospiraceae bacterium]|nr:amidohydrolase family protein [Saprospiraceae bacterium]
MSKLIFISFIVCISVSAYSQPAPAAKQREAIAIVGATIHVGNGQSIANGVLVFDKGILQYVGTDLSKAATIKNRIDANGKHIYPGFICMATNLGLAEIEQVKATIDYEEFGSMNPNVRSLTSYNTDSKIIPTVRSNGMLLAQVIPNGGIISGQSSVMQLDAWNWEDAVVKADEGIFLNWPSPNPPRRFGPDADKNQQDPDRYQTEMNALKAYFDEAFAYSKVPHTSNINLSYEAMKDLFNGTKKLYIRTQAAKAIIHSVQFAEKYGLKPVLVGANEAWRVVDFLKEHQIALILGQVHSLPAREDDDYDQPFKNPKILQDAGILYCFSITGFWEQRNLHFQAGHALGFGLDYEQAIAGLSLNPAKILGLDHRLGSLEVGKDATFIISDGDVLDMRTSHVSRAFIQGRAIDLDNKQKELYRRFYSKYHPE